MLTSISAQAQEADNSLAQLHTFRVSNYISLDAYYRFIGSGNTDTLNEIVAGINSANDSMNLLATSTSGALTSGQTEELNGEFDKFKSLMRDNINDVRNTGYPVPPGFRHGQPSPDHERHGNRALPDSPRKLTGRNEPKSRRSENGRR